MPMYLMSLFFLEISLYYSNMPKIMFLLLAKYHINSTLKKFILPPCFNLRLLIMPKSPPTIIVYETRGHMFD
jgi:hypothetical protein